jgi:hypothetical protein
VKTAYDKDLTVNGNRNAGTASNQWVTEDAWTELKAWWKDNPMNESEGNWNAHKNKFTTHYFTDVGHRRDEHNDYELPTGELHYGVNSDVEFLNYHIRVAVSKDELTRVTPPPPPPPPKAALPPPAVVKDAWDD